MAGSFSFFKLSQYSLQSAVFIILYVQSEEAVRNITFVVVCCFYTTEYTVRSSR